jgi:SAM-dependent methyltransferase
LAAGGFISIPLLEHVMDPGRVMREIVRVTEPGGLLYSEVPFMQQVHEGAHDFERFTLSGHGWLTIIDSVIAQRPAALDGASCTFVLGRLRPQGSISDAQIIEGYRGAQGPH